MPSGSSRYIFVEVCVFHSGLTHACALQAFAGIVTVSVGHCHPKVVDAVKRQSELLQHTTTIYLNPQIALYAKELTDRLPGNLKVRLRRYCSLLLMLYPQHAGDLPSARVSYCFLLDGGGRSQTATQVAYFLNCGSEANGMAIMMPRLYRGNYNMLALLLFLVLKVEPSVQVAYFVNSGSEANDMAIMMAWLYTGNYDMLALLPFLVLKVEPSVQVAYFVNSGSEANDMAITMARLYTGNYDVVALRNCYHGMSEGTMGVTAHSTWKFNVPQVGLGFKSVARVSMIDEHASAAPKCPANSHLDNLCTASSIARTSVVHMRAQI